MKDQLEKIFDSIAASAVPAQEAYTDSETGLLHCGKCHTPIQCRVTLFDKEKLMPCTCHCRQEQIAAEEQARKEQQRLDRIRRLKANGLQDRALFAYTFDKADNDNPAMKYAHRYVTHWAEVKTEGQGLLFWGGVGTGKTFAAACIANALTEQGIPVLMTNFSKILNSLSGMFSTAIISERVSLRLGGKAALLSHNVLVKLSHIPVPPLLMGKVLILVYGFVKIGVNFNADLHG